MATQATAIFHDRHAAHAAIQQLVQAGFPRDAISVLMTETTHEREFGTAPSDADKSGIRSRPDTVLAAILSGLVALRYRCGLSLRATGPLVGALLHHAAEGLFVAGLVASGLGAHQARLVDERVRQGEIVVGVHSGSDRTRLATQLLELSGGAAVDAA